MSKLAPNLRQNLRQTCAKTYASMSSFNPTEFLSHTPIQPGVYQMLDESGQIIYVGKAKNLKARLTSYFQTNTTSPKTRLLVSHIADIKTLVTHTETEALLLEQTLIKEHHPRYNILLRDDKSYPYIYLSDHPEFPHFRLYRGPKRKGGQYFGPYPSALAAREMLEWIQKFFKIRSCNDTFFAHRSRPCLQYQIKRCKAPCVNLVTQTEYRHDLNSAILFLQGKDETILEMLRAKMEQASNQLAFDKAIEYRDLIADLQAVRQKQHVIHHGLTQEADLIYFIAEYGLACVQKILIRNGKVVAGKSFFPSLPPDTDLPELAHAFMTQHYLNNEDIPEHIYLNVEFEEAILLETLLSEKLQHKITIHVPKRGEKVEWLALAKTNAEQAFAQYREQRASYAERFTALQKLLHSENPILQMECFDISHTQGEATVASCVVFDVQGAKKAAYRRFNIENIIPGDDYAAMEQALRRRYQRLVEEQQVLPDLLVIDGGKGQLAQAERVLAELNIHNMALIGIAKGTTRKPGLETLFLESRGQGIDANDEPLALHLLQEIRDEAHRFAITGHRARRAKQRGISPLEHIEGIGPTRRRELLRHFGGWQALSQASAKELAAVAGISRNLAEKIHSALH